MLGIATLFPFDTTAETYTETTATSKIKYIKIINKTTEVDLSHLDFNDPRLKRYGERLLNKDFYKRLNITEFAI
jgi:hypothetical protein